MTIIWLNLLLFVGAIIVFALYTVTSYRGVDSPKSFFYKKDLPANVISLTSANVTLGTGLAYLVQGGQQNGILMLLIPVMVWLGYYLLAEFIERFVASDVLEGANYFYAINDAIRRQTGSPSPFNTLVSISLIAIFVLILPFEIFASSRIITPLLVQGGGVAPQIILSLTIFAAALVYVSFGGIKAVLATDKLQFMAIISFLVVLTYIAFIGLSDSDLTSTQIFEHTLKFNTNVIMAVIAACISAISTQFYSLMNWGYVSHMESRDRSLMLKRVGIYSALILTVIVSLGVFYPSKEGSDVISGLMSLFVQKSGGSGNFILIIGGLSILGMISIVFSTVDSLIIKIAMFYYQNIAKRDSRNSERNPAELRLIRRIILSAFGIIFLALGYFNFMQPNVFYLLLAIVAGINIFAPMLATAGYLSHRRALSIFTPFVVWGYFSLFMITGAISIYLFFINPALLGWAGTTSFIVSSLFSLWILFSARNLKSDIKSATAES